jgi:predicted metalloprotease
MRWNRGHRSDDIIDRRGQRPAFGGGGMRGLGGLVPLLFRFKWGWLIALILLAVIYFGPSLFGGGGGQSVRPAGPRSDDDLAAFAAFVLDDVQATFERKLEERGERYRRAKMVLFTDATNTACGFGEAATGPFYCPADERAYLDLGFFRELSQKLGAPGDFAQAYVIAHEIGHHLQNLLGANKAVHRAPRSQQVGAEGLSVRLELQADCYAGIWAHSTSQRDLLEEGDIEEAFDAAAAIGDDRLQRMAGQRVSPEKWTHGSSELRMHWFKRGQQSGDMSQCDTFGGTL